MMLPVGDYVGMVSSRSLNYTWKFSVTEEGVVRKNVVKATPAVQATKRKPAKKEKKKNVRRRNKR